ncbi:MAG: NAD(P)H-hydrate dehydratase [Candidatus Electrothrix sp. ATG2]|nr:NAD(P)H-hydrate dehydratase [Candidatus Electrothrix sp. ATG2]
MKIATSGQMQALDRIAIEEIGLPGVVLMENAGKGTVDAMEQEYGAVWEKTVCIFIGPGNNGGDGLVIARHVAQRGGRPFLIFLINPEKLGGDAGTNAKVCNKLGFIHYLIHQGDEVRQLKELIRQLHCTHPVHSLVDALFGTGLSRKIKGYFIDVIDFINSIASDRKWPVVAVDIPSGLCADTGTSLGCAVQADHTVTYGLAKPGHFHHGGPMVGKLTVVDISIPNRVVKQADLPGQVFDHCEIARCVQERQTTSHKGTYGHLFILAGSEGKSGAAILAGKGALHSGCGLVTLAAPTELNSVYETSLPEAMTVPLPNSSRMFCAADYELIRELLADRGALVVGPGIGTDPETGLLVRRLYRDLKLPMVIDADALNLLAAAPEVFGKSSGVRIFTPHPGEMSRLTGRTVAAVQADRLGAADQLAKDLMHDEHEVIVVLKGAGTVLSSSKKNWAVNSSGNHGMATGGMGDVLAGLIGGLLVQGYSPWDAAAIGVYQHGLAADLLAEECSHGFTASQVAAALPRAFARIKKSDCRPYPICNGPGVYACKETS